MGILDLPRRWSEPKKAGLGFDWPVAPVAIPTLCLANTCNTRSTETCDVGVSLNSGTSSGWRLRNQRETQHVGFNSHLGACNEFINKRIPHQTQGHPLINKLGLIHMGSTSSDIKGKPLDFSGSSQNSTCPFQDSSKAHLSHGPF